MLAITCSMKEENKGSQMGHTKKIFKKTTQQRLKRWHQRLIIRPQKGWEDFSHILVWFVISPTYIFWLQKWSQFPGFRVGPIWVTSRAISSGLSKTKVQIDTKKRVTQKVFPFTNPFYISTQKYSPRIYFFIEFIAPFA